MPENINPDDFLKYLDPTKSLDNNSKMIIESHILNLHIKFHKKTALTIIKSGFIKGHRILLNEIEKGLPTVEFDPMVFVMSLASVIDRFIINNSTPTNDYPRLNNNHMAFSIENIKQQVSQLLIGFERLQKILSSEKIIRPDRMKNLKMELDKLKNDVLVKISAPKFQAERMKQNDKIPPGFIEEVYKVFKEQTYGLRNKQLARIIAELLSKFGREFNQENIRKKITEASKGA